VQGRDTFETPNYAVDLLIPFIPKNVGTIWECAAGGGKIAVRLEGTKRYGVYTTDIRFEPDIIDRQFNFITETLEDSELSSIDCIITNPPFSIKDLFIEKAFEYNKPFAFLINADYSATSINWIKRGCEKIIPTSRIAYITPDIVSRVNSRENTIFERKDEIPSQLIYKYSSAQFHSMWLTYGFDLGRTETFVDLTAETRKNNA
jgi:hypothetical protein